MIGGELELEAVAELTAAEGMSQREIGQVLGVHNETVRVPRAHQRAEYRSGDGARDWRQITKHWRAPTNPSIGFTSAALAQHGPSPLSTATATIA